MTAQSATTSAATFRIAPPITAREGVDWRRLAAAAGLAAVASAAANALLRLAAVEAFDIHPGFEPLEAAGPVQASIVAACGAAIVLAVLARFSDRPISLFRRVSLAVFVLSFIPLVPMYLADPPQFPGTDVASVGTLALMHVVSAAIVVPTLSALPRRTPST